MRIPGLWAPSPEVISQLWEQSDPYFDPFTALGGGIEAWELNHRLGGGSELTAHAGMELLERTLGTDFQTSPIPTEGDARLFFERVPSDLRLSAAIDTLQVRLRQTTHRLRALEADPKAHTPLGPNTQPAYIYEAAINASWIQRGFAAVPSSQALVLLEALLPWLEAPLVAWAWCGGAARTLWGPEADPSHAGADVATPERVWNLLTAFVGDDMTGLFEANLALRLVQGPPSMSSHVCGRWLVQQIWSDDGVQAPIPKLDTPLMQELPRAYDLVEAFRTAKPNSGHGRAYAEQHAALDRRNEYGPNDLVMPQGIALGTELLLARYTKLQQHGGEDKGLSSIHEILQRTRVGTESEAKEDPDCLTTYAAQHQAWQDCAQRSLQRLDRHEDPSGSLGFSPYRTLLFTVDSELAVHAASTVLKWRHWFHQHRLKTDAPKGFLQDVEAFYANTIATLDGTTPQYVHRSRAGDTGYWFGESGHVAALTDKDDLDWRVTEVLRPLIYSALSSMCAGLRIPGAERLYQHSDWVNTQVWRPTWPGITIRKAINNLYLIAAGERRPCTDARVQSLWQEQTAAPEELDAWLQAQPFDLVMLERFRTLVVAKETEVGLIGSLPETLYARPHYKPSWVVSPLALLTEPRKLQADPLL